MSIPRAYMFLDGSHACALLGEDLQDGEAEFSPIEGWPQATIRQERSAMGRALRALEARINNGQPMAYAMYSPRE